MKKLISIIFLLTSFLLQGQSLDQKLITLNFSGNLVSLLDSIETRFDVNVNYKLQFVENKSITLNCIDESLPNILTIIEDKCDLSYHILDQTSISFYPIQKHIISGIVVESGSSERISDAIIKINNTTFTTSDELGMFQISVPNRLITLDVYHPSHQINNIQIKVNQNQYLIIRLKEVDDLAVVEINSQEIKSNQLKDYEETNASHLLFPSLNGKIDAINSIKLIPGIQNISFGQQGLSVRGGGPDQNFILVDGIPVYNTFHLMGLYSIFNSNIVNNVRVYKDVFPSKYSNRLSSVIDVGLNNGNKQKTELFIDLGLLSSGIAVNGPIVKNKLSYSVSARRTYLDILVRPFQNIWDRSNALKNKSYLWSLDIFGKIHYQINEHNQLSLTSYYGGDQLNFTSKLNSNSSNQFQEKTKGALGWRNKLVGIKWNSKINARLNLGTEASFSSYNLNLLDEYILEEDDNFSSNSSKFKSGIQELRSAMDATIYINEKNLAKFGLGVTNYSFLPYERSYNTRYENYVSSNNSYELDTVLLNSSFNTYEYYSFIENKTYFSRGYLNYGIRFTQYSDESDKVIYYQPKLYSLLNITKNTQLRLGYSITNQFIQLIPNNNLGLPIDLWLPVSNSLKPITVNQLAGKFNHRINNGNISIGFFDKKFNHIAEYNLNTPNILIQNWESNIVQGIGNSYGIETSFDYKFDNFSLNAVYTYCRSNRTIEEINNGERYYSKFDRPHDFSVWASHSFSKNKKLMVSFNYISGNPITIPAGRYETYINDERIIIEDFDEINNFRLPAIHHIDVSYSVEKQHKKFNSTLVVGIYNVYNRFNPFMAFIGLNENSEPVLKIRSLMPALPIVKYAIKL